MFMSQISHDFFKEDWVNVSPQLEEEEQTSSSAFLYNIFDFVAWSGWCLRAQQVHANSEATDGKNAVNKTKN